MRRMAHWGIIWAASLLVATATSATAAEPKAEERDPNVLAEFPIFNDGDVLLVPVQVSGKTCQFMVATGSTFVVFDPQLESAFTRMKNRGKATIEVPGGGTLEWALAKEFSIEGLPPFRSRRILLKDLSVYREATGHNINGIFGMELLHAFVMRIDADRSRLQFLKFAPESDLPTISMRWNRRVPVVSVRVVPDVVEDFFIDTGSPSVVTGASLAPTLYQKLFDGGQLRYLYSSRGATLGTGN